jgi:hypothetical protein
VLDGTAYEHAERDPELAVGNVRRFENKTEPEVIAQVPLAGGGTVEVYAVAKRWNPARILVSWADDNMHPHWRGPQPAMSAESPTPNGTSGNTGAAKSSAVFGGAIGCQGFCRSRESHGQIMGKRVHHRAIKCHQ